MLAEIQRKAFTTEEYHRMIETGILKEGDRVELIEGEIIAMAAIGSLHAACVNRLNRLFTKTFSDRVIVAVQNPICLMQYSEPEPDITLLQPREDFYATEHPRPEDAYLIVEVADTSLDYDRGFKLPLYARAAIREVWIADLGESCVEVYSKPSKRGYGMLRKFHQGDIIVSEPFPDETFNVNDILG